MTIMNILLTVVVLAIAGYGIFYVIKKKKSAEVENTLKITHIKEVKQKLDTK